MDPEKLKDMQEAPEMSPDGGPELPRTPEDALIESPVARLEGEASRDVIISSPAVQEPKKFLTKERAGRAALDTISVGGFGLMGVLKTIYGYARAALKGELSYKKGKEIVQEAFSTKAKPEKK